VNSTNEFVTWTDAARRLGAVIRASREVVGLTQGSIRNVSDSVVSDLERGSRLPHSKIVIGIAEAVGADLVEVRYLLRRAGELRDVARLRARSAAFAPFPPSARSRPSGGSEPPYIEVVSAEGMAARATPGRDDLRNTYLMPHTVLRAVDRYRLGLTRGSASGVCTRLVQATEKSLDTFYWTLAVEPYTAMQYLRVQVCGDAVVTDVVEARPNSYVFVLAFRSTVIAGAMACFTVHYEYATEDDEEPGRWLRLRMPAEEVEVSVDFPIGGSPSRVWWIDQPTEQAIDPKPVARRLLDRTITGTYVIRRCNVRPETTIGIHWRW
jgi:hypothetical protein